jgi:hypothetical protein
MKPQVACGKPVQDKTPAVIFDERGTRFAEDGQGLLQDADCLIVLPAVRVDASQVLQGVPFAVPVADLPGDRQRLLQAGDRIRVPAKLGMQCAQVHEAHGLIAGRPGCTVDSQ